MINRWKAMLMGLAVTVAFAGAPARVHAVAACGDVNNNGTFDASDCLVLLQCLNGACPAPPAGGFCGTGNILDCGNMFKDNPAVGNLTGADVAVCNDTANHLPTLYDACQGPGDNITCTTPDPCFPGFNKVELGSQTITTSQTWPANCHVYITGTVFIGYPTVPPLITPVIRIQPGSVIRAHTVGADPAALIFLPKTHIDAQGNQASPIILTSGDGQLPCTVKAGNRHPGDWGGLEFLGQSSVNRPECKGSAEGIPLAFGGCINNDTSGIMTFTRVEFGGQIFTMNNELNDITFNAIGSTTQFNFLAAAAGDDDTFEWFGGTSSHHHFYSAASADDNFDTQLGFTGTLQYGIAIQNPATMQVGRDCRGIESDNSEFDPEALPRNFPTNCNLTMIGGNKMPGANCSPTNTGNDGSDSGMLLRRGGDYHLANSIIQDFNDSGFEMRDVSTATQACNAGPTLTGKVIVASSVFYDNGSQCATGAATEQVKDNDGTLDTTAGCDLNPCAAAACNCDSEQLYNLFVTTQNVANACGSNATNTGISDQYPPDDNSACTGLETPWVCCTGAGTGTCHALPNVIPNPTGDPFPPAFNCKTGFTPIMDNTTYIGAVNPAAGPSCVYTGASAHCDWLSKPWIESAIN